MSEVNPLAGSGKISEEINHPVPCKKAPKSSDNILKVALNILEGLGLILANILTLGFINFLPGIHEAYKKVFGGKEVEVISQSEEIHEEVQEPSVEVKSLSVEGKENSNTAKQDEEKSEPSVNSTKNSNTHEVDEESDKPSEKSAENEKDPSLKDDPKEEPLPLGSQEEEPAPSQEHPKDKDKDKEIDFKPVDTTHVPPPTAYFNTERYGNAFDNIRDVATTVYEGANRENAEHAWDQTKAGASWALRNTQLGLKTAWEGCTKENAQKAKASTLENLQKVGKFAMRPENRCQAIAATTAFAAIGAGIVGIGLSGGNPENEFHDANENL